jgi:hypothetical protein
VRKLKKRVKFLTTICLGVLSIILMFGIKDAKALIIDSVPIMMIDGGDSNTSVNISIMDGVNGFDFGYLNNSGVFETLLSNGNDYGFHSWNGGEVIDFAIKNVSTQAVYSLGDEPDGSNYCKLDFFGEITASNSQNPVVQAPYWRMVQMHWEAPGVEANSYDVLMEMSNNGDGVAPVVPEPATMSLLGLGALGLLGFRKKA